MRDGRSKPVKKENLLLEVGIKHFKNFEIIWATF